MCICSGEVTIFLCPGSVTVTLTLEPLEIVLSGREGEGETREIGVDSGREGEGETREKIGGDSPESVTS